ncbi:putative protein kinase RLK-Pelle-WAK family [Helianthus annuus]|nr:putative protein kinase RLK-Pelle-WAK family [Helianthus annuus]
MILPVDMQITRVLTLQGKLVATAVYVNKAIKEIRICLRAAKISMNVITRRSFHVMEIVLRALGAYSVKLIGEVRSRSAKLRQPFGRGNRGGEMVGNRWRLTEREGGERRQLSNQWRHQMGVLGEFKRGVDVAHGDWFGVREGTHLLGVHPLHPNTIGSYTCECKSGYSGDAMVKDGCRRKPFNVLRLSIGLGLGIFTLLTGLFVLLLMVKQRKLIKLREQFFEQNGGVLLEEKLKTTGRSVMKIFQVEELKEATNNYAEDNILGKGGNGTVYKGTLPDTRLVAIKKSQRLDQGQRDQFINEMVILAQINHKNVVQLLGCCLETDVPMLAYEYVSNDTLYRHIHKTSGKGRLSWDSRLRIAHESAGALAFLHNDARMSVIHRDVKSTNILLDDNYTAKIADFGASRLVPLGHDEVTTLVQGTIGYLDPEYFHTGHLTDKSDVYSFGVVLVELLTGKKTIDPERGAQDTNLATHFLKAKKENRLLEILDQQVVKEATEEQLKATCDMVCRCLNQVGGSRPSMKDVAMELEILRKSSKQHPWISEQNYTEASSLMIESEEQNLYAVPLIANSDTFGEYSSSTMGMNEIMLHVHSPR